MKNFLTILINFPSFNDETLVGASVNKINKIAIIITLYSYYVNLDLELKAFNFN